MNDSVWIHFAPQRDRRRAAACAIAAPAYPPISACEELDGIPKYHVMRFQAIAPSSAAEDHVRVDDALLDHAAADRLRDGGAEPVNAAAKLKTAAQITAASGLQHARADDRRDRVRRIVEAVDEIEDERDQDDRDDVGDHAARLTRS